MADWQQKRFWMQVEIMQQEVGYTVLLDDCLVKTPAKTLLALPSQALAEAVAEAHNIGLLSGVGIAQLSGIADAIEVRHHAPAPTQPFADGLQRLHHPIPGQL